MVAGNGVGIKLEHVSKLYETMRGEQIKAIDEVTLDVKSGEFLSIVGPSGCGKSTLMKLASGLIMPSGGRVEVNGELVTGPVSHAGVVFQRDLLLDWRSVLGNVLLQAEIRGLPRISANDRAKALLDLVGLAGCEHQMPRELSGGMRQRVAICRMLLHDPEFIMMDEPFGALDAMTRDQLNLDMQVICQTGKKTILFITHSLDEAVFLSDRIIVMGVRPSRIVDIIDVNLDRPRRLDIKDSQSYGKYVRQLRGTFEAMGILRDLPSC